MTSLLPAGFSLRTATIDDLPQTVELSNLYSTHITGEPLTTLDISRKTWQQDTFHPETDVLLVFDPDQTLVGYSQVHASAGNRFIMQWGCVHPDYKGQGIGTTLVAGATERAIHYARLAEDEQEVRLHIRLDTRDEAAARLMDSLGFSCDRYWYEMRMTLNQEIPRPQWSPSVHLEAFDPEKDMRSIYDADNEAFNEHFGFIVPDYDEWVVRMQSGSFNPEMWTLVKDGDNLAGFLIGQLNRNGTEGLGWVRVLGVRKQWRKQGIGLALLHHAFHQLQAKGMTQVGLNVDSENPTGALRLYERAGMHIYRQMNYYSKVLKAGKTAHHPG